jgi:hypothetical protein
MLSSEISLSFLAVFAILHRAIRFFRNNVHYLGDIALKGIANPYKDIRVQVFAPIELLKRRGTYSRNSNQILFFHVLINQQFP